MPLTIIGKCWTGCKNKYRKYRSNNLRDVVRVYHESNISNSVFIETMGRKLYKWVERKDGYGLSTYSAVEDPTEGELVSSLLPNGMHAPVIDLDFPCQLVPSSTPGHFHLYIDKAISWDDYEQLLVGLRNSGLIEPGWYSQSIRDKKGLVRWPGVYKAFDELKAKVLETGSLF